MKGLFIKCRGIITYNIIPLLFNFALFRVCVSLWRQRYNISIWLDLLGCCLKEFICTCWWSKYLISWLECVCSMQLLGVSIKLKMASVWLPVAKRLRVEEASFSSTTVWVYPKILSDIYKTRAQDGSFSIV